MEKLKKNAILRDVVVDNTKSDNSVSIQLNTGAYLTVLVPLVGFYLKNKGKEIDSKNTKGHKVMIKDAERQSDARGVIVSTLVDLEVDGQHVKMTAYDTTGLVRVQGKAAQLFAGQLLGPHLEKNASLAAKDIKLTNEKILTYNSKTVKTKGPRGIRKSANKKSKGDKFEPIEEDDSDDELVEEKQDDVKQIEQEFQCTECNFNLIGERALEQHMAVSHLPQSAKTLDLTASQKLIIPMCDADSPGSSDISDDEDENVFEQGGWRSDVNQLQLALTNMEETEENDRHLTSPTLCEAVIHVGGGPRQLESPAERTQGDFGAPSHERESKLPLGPS